MDRRLVPQSSKHCHSPQDLLGAHCQSRCGEERARCKETGKREMMFCVPLHHRGRLFPPHHYSPGNLGLPIKRDHTANMKYTLCVERLIKY